jgi:poly(hydroxyalkanoate) depolymerase family esterase
MKLLSRLPGDRKPPSTGASAGSPAEHIARALSAAGLDRKRHHTGIRATIERALESAGLHAHRESPEAVADASRTSAPASRRAATPDRAPAAKGQFLHATYANAHGKRDYRLYLPVGYDAAGPARPLILMLHGCTQSAEDFAAGTRMNTLADRHGFLVAYPQQIGKANHAKCWNWFRPDDQRGDAGEPSILAGIARQVAHDHRVDTGKVFVAGLSAGAAMAVILGHTHPDLIRAVGVHSGLPYASAHDVPSAFAAMQGRGVAARAQAAHGPAVPMILFHGDEDRTVAASNADALAAATARPGQRTRTETGRVPGGQAYTRQVVVDEAGRPRLERWTVHGAGHAWSGGDPASSYTDPAGPDASAAMVDFFNSLD